MYRALVALLLLVSAPAWAGGIAGNGGTGIEGNPTGGGGGSGSPAGNTNDLQINAGSGNFGAITPGSGVATALGVNLNGTGALSATTSPTFVTPVLGAASATSINATGGTPYSVTGTEVINLYSNQTSPIADGELNSTNPALIYFPGPTATGYGVTQNAYGGGYDNVTTSDYTINGTLAAHVGQLKTSVILVAGTGTPFINGELNQEKSQVTIPTNVTVATGENKELNLSVTGGTVTKWYAETLYPANGSTGTIGTYFGASYVPTNLNTTAGSWGASYGYDCAGFAGGGAAPTTNVCFYNADYTASNLNYGHSNTRVGSGHNPTVSANCSIDTIGSTEGGNDETGLLTITGASTSCTVTFAVAYGNATHCSISSPDGSQYISYTQAPTTALTINYVSASSGHFIYHCMGGT